MQILNGFTFVFNHPLNKGHFEKTLARVFWWKVNQLFFSLPTVVSLTERIQCICYPQLSYSGLIVYTKWPDFVEWKFLLEYLQEDHTFVDIGAHTGDYSLIAADKIISGSIFAFEPEPSVLPYLRQNVALNSLEKVITVIPQAVSNKVGKVSFSLDAHSETSHLTKGNETKNQRKVKIPCTTLDAFATKQKLTSIDVLKIDVEGAEGLVFSGMKQLLRHQKIDVIFFELNPQSREYGFSAKDVLSLLHVSRYTLYTLTGPQLQPISLDIILTETRNFVALSIKAKKNSLVKKYL